jgi:hypothetical protein
MDNIEVKLKPQTTMGKWSIGFIISLSSFFIIGVAIVNFGHQTGGETFFDNLYISIPMFLAGLSGIAAFITGIIGIINDHERALLVFVSSVIGSLVLIFMLGEFLFPH